MIDFEWSLFTTVEGGVVPKKGSSGGKVRSAVSGRYVSPKYGKTHPKTTVKEKK